MTKRALSCGVNEKPASADLPLYYHTQPVKSRCRSPRRAGAGKSSFEPVLKKKKGAIHDMLWIAPDTGERRTSDVLFMHTAKYLHLFFR